MEGLLTVIDQPSFFMACLKDNPLTNHPPLARTKAGIKIGLGAEVVEQSFCYHLVC